MKRAAEEKLSSENTQAPTVSGAPAFDSQSVSDQADSELNNLDDVAPEEDGKALLTLDWLRKAVAQEEVVREDVPQPEITPAPTAEKKDLTLEERKKVKPSGDFLMDLTKAMLRSGYYSADHPGSEGAKQGLYEKLQNCLGESRQVEITKQETREQTDILISGILEEPVNVRTLVGAGMADLFRSQAERIFQTQRVGEFRRKK